LGLGCTVALGVYRGPPEVYRGPCMKITCSNQGITYTHIPCYAYVLHMHCTVKRINMRLVQQSSKFKLVFTQIRNIHEWIIMMQNQRLASNRVIVVVTVTFFH